MRAGKRRALPDTPEGHLDDLIETVKPHIRANIEHPFRVIKRQFGLQKMRLRGMFKNRSKVNVLATLTHLFMDLHQLLCKTYLGVSTPIRDSASPRAEEKPANKLKSDKLRIETVDISLMQTQGILEECFEAFV